MPLAIESDDLTPLPHAHRQGLTGVAVLASLSFGLCAIVLLYLTYKLIRWHITTRWRRHSAVETVDLSLGLAERHFTGTTDDGTQVGGGSRGRTKKPYPNQFLVLIYNLLLADLHQAGAFLLNGVWVRKNGIEVRNPACFLQGWLVSTGDLSSSCFITAIAVHTYLAIVWNYRPPQRLLYLTIVSLWVFDYTLAILGPVTTNNGAEHGGFYVRAAAWCWVSVKFETHRLVLHYLFIFISLAITSVLYILIFLSLRKRPGNRRRNPRSQQPNTSPTSTISRPDSSHYRSDPESQIQSSSISKRPVTTTDALANTTTSATTTSAPNTSADDNDQASGYHRVFLLYPVIYVVCTAPLALGRIATMAKVDVPISYFCVAGALIGSNGWLDVLLWGVTRQDLLFGSDVGKEETGLDTFTFMRTPHDRRYGNIVWVEGAVNGVQEGTGVGGGEVGNNNGDNGSTRRGRRKRSSRSRSRWWEWTNWIERRMGWEKLDFGLMSSSSDKSHRHHGRTVSQESLRGFGTTDRRSLRQHHHQQSTDHHDGPPPMSGGIHMDLVTSVVVVERPDLEKENREYLERTVCGGAKCLLEYCKNTVSCKGHGHGHGLHGNMSMDMDLDNMDLPELQDPSGYLTSASADDLSAAAAQKRDEAGDTMNNKKKEEDG